MDEDKREQTLASAFPTSRPRHLRRNRLWLNIVIVKILLYYDLFRNELRGWSIVNVDEVSKGVERKALKGVVWRIFR